MTRVCLHCGILLFSVIYVFIKGVFFSTTAVLRRVRHIRGGVSVKYL